MTLLRTHIVRWLACACALGVAFSCGNGDPQKKAKTKSEGEKAADGDSEDSGEETSEPQDVSGAALVDISCTWGEEIDEKHAEVGCRADPSETAKKEFSLTTPTREWHMLDASDKPMKVDKIEVPADLEGRFHVIYKMPIAEALNARAAVDEIDAGKRKRAKNALSDSLDQLGDKATVDCIKKDGAAHCVKKALQALFYDSVKPMHVLTSFVSGAHIAYIPDVATAAAFANVCNRDGIKPEVKLATGSTNIDLASGDYCFEAFSTVTQFASVAAHDWTGVRRYAPRLFGSAPDENGKPSCLFVVGKKKESDGKGRVLIVENAGTIGPNVVNPANLLATVREHACD